MSVTTQIASPVHTQCWSDCTRCLRRSAFQISRRARPRRLVEDRRTAVEQPRIAEQHHRTNVGLFRAYGHYSVPLMFGLALQAQDHDNRSRRTMARAARLFTTAALEGVAGRLSGRMLEDRLPGALTPSQPRY